ncbi:unnamed protein product [Zymoseptoria tritici ST99CH_1A5]|uniref:Uncharacterized protein n=1 Tax=Zymoseptoria tritici ST99CH_1A5 TaxID=1276529 RepID=A0A1Y6LZ88_ZYMTR|nr:unnamed protein product [Zymoseptoria tritici ST99CH_1A5]
MDRKSPAAARSTATYEAVANDDVSMHTTRSDYNYDDPFGLPSYNDSVAASSSAHHRASPPADEYAVIAPPKPASEGWHTRKSRNQDCSQQVRIGAETSLRMDERLVHPAQLYDYVNDYLRLIKPQPMVRVQGWHWQTRQRVGKRENKTQQERVYDFDVVLSMHNFLPSSTDRDAADDVWWVPHSVENSDKAHRGSWRKTRAKGSTQHIEVGEDRKPELLDWCEDFCSNTSALKIFRVSRNVTGLDTDAIQEMIVPLVRQTHYRGHINITFPIADKNVDIYSPHWINRARMTWVRWIFYLTFLWIFTWPVLLFTTKRWGVYKVDWRVSHEYVESDGTRRKRYATISEHEWVRRHANLIKSLVLDKFHGDATTFPTDVDEADAQRRRISMPRAGNGSLDSALSFIQGGVGAWGALNGRGGDGWGADC